MSPKLAHPATSIFRKLFVLLRIWVPNCRGTPVHHLFFLILYFYKRYFWELFFIFRSWKKFKIRLVNKIQKARKSFMLRFHWLKNLRIPMSSTLARLRVGRKRKKLAKGNDFNAKKIGRWCQSLKTCRMVTVLPMVILAKGNVSTLK